MEFPAGEKVWQAGKAAVNNFLREPFDKLAK